MRGSGWVFVVTILLTGCVGLPASGPTLTASFTPTERPVVIAVLDTGAIPYLPIFEAEIDPLISTVAPGATRVELTQAGSIPERSLADNDTLNALEPHVLYHFAHTRLLAISFEGPRTYPYTQDIYSHGVATSYFAARDAPNAIIVAVQITGHLCLEDDLSCFFDPHAATGMEWIADQDWIDVVSISLGVPGNIPETGTVHPEVVRYREATERVARSGKIVVSAAGNDPSPALMDFFDGPPWMICVGGFEFGQKGEQLESPAAGMDVAANYTDWGPEFMDGNMTWRAGTSFSGPIVAGTLANALGIIREQDPTRATSPNELREALNATAQYFTPTQWDPRPPNRDRLPWDVINYASLPILVQPQMGWGYVNASMAPEIARRVLEQDFSIPAEKDQAMLFQPAWQRAREEYWAQDRPRP